MARMISSKLLVLAVGALTMGAGLFATTGTASADGPYGGNDWHDNDGHDIDWHDNDWHNNGGGYGNNWDWDKHDDDCDDHSWSRDSRYEHDYWNAGWDEDKHWDDKDWDWNKHDCDDDDDHVHYVYVLPTTYVHYPVTPPEFGRYSDGLAGLITDASMVLGITEQALYEKLALGWTLADIGIQYNLGQLDFADKLVAMNPDLAQNITAIIWQPWLLASNIWIPI